jgi:hypothetical protein
MQSQDLAHKVAYAASSKAHLQCTAWAYSGAVRGFPAYQQSTQKIYDP